jgi:hypothetical protein
LVIISDDSSLPLDVVIGLQCEEPEDRMLRLRGKVLSRLASLLLLLLLMEPYWLQRYLCGIPITMEGDYWKIKRRWAIYFLVVVM